MTEPACEHLWERKLTYRYPVCARCGAVDHSSESTPASPSDPVPVTFTTYDPGISHARRAGERFSICGSYVRIDRHTPESVTPRAPLCRKCGRDLGPLPPTRYPGAAR